MWGEKKKVSKIHLAKGRIKHSCKLLLWQVLIQEGISAPSMLLPPLRQESKGSPTLCRSSSGCLLQAVLPDHCGKARWSREVLSSGACLENRSLYKKTRCANVHFRGFLQAVVQELHMAVNFISDSKTISINSSPFYL